ncbi:hypothetical protein BHE74_00013331 [Ensete ventricosum]|nr:hypothetical protein BHE74_00013331 [Ensete ventricosum]
MERELLGYGEGRCCMLRGEQGDIRGGGEGEGGGERGCQGSGGGKGAIRNEDEEAVGEARADPKEMVKWDGEAVVTVERAGADEGRVGSERPRVSFHRRRKVPGRASTTVNGSNGLRFGIKTPNLDPNPTH